LNTGLVPLRHSFDLTVAEARALQERLRVRVEARDRLGPIERIAGVDVSYDRGSPVLFAAVVVLDARSLAPGCPHAARGRRRGDW
jgi:deoxyribonuclease V